MTARDKRTPTVLFVDDEVEICRSLAQALAEFGYETSATTDPYEALELAERNDFDLAIVDLVMPKMDGVELVKRLLRVDPRMRCCILTAYGAVDSCNRAYQAGIVRYLQKPVSVKVLHTLFIELLDFGDSALFPLPELAAFTADGAIDEDQAEMQPSSTSVAEPMMVPDPDSVSLDAFKRSAIERYLRNAARLCQGSPKLIAQKAGISLPTTYRLLAEYDIPYDRKAKRKTETSEDRK